MAIDYSAIVQAVRAWLRTSTGLADDKVILEDQVGPGLAAPFATVKLHQAVKPFGQDFRDHSYDGAAPAGEELELFATGPRLVAVSINVYSKGTTGNAAAAALLANARDGLELESTTAALAAAGAALQDCSEVRELNALLETSFRGRAHLDLTLNVSSFASERTTYIETVSGTGTVTDPSGANPVSVPFTASIPD